jgi:hypothetical protein
LGMSCEKIYKAIDYKMNYHYSINWRAVKKLFLKIN